MSENEQKAGCVDLPELPEPDFMSGDYTTGETAYTAEQMRAYARAALEAAALSPARSGEAVAGLVKRWREAADWLDSFGDNPTMRSRAEGFRVCADALEELT